MMNFLKLVNAVNVWTFMQPKLTVTQFKKCTYIFREFASGNSRFWLLLQEWNEARCFACCSMRWVCRWVSIHMLVIHTHAHNLACTHTRTHTYPLRLAHMHTHIIHTQQCCLWLRCSSPSSQAVAGVACLKQFAHCWHCCCFCLLLLGVVAAAAGR